MFYYFNENPALQTISDIVKVVSIIYKGPKICLATNMTFLLIKTIFRPSGVIYFILFFPSRVIFLESINYKLVNHSTTVVTNSRSF